MSAQAVAVAIQCNIPVLWWGNPGVGKTSMLRQVACALDVPIEVLIASIHEPSDFGGLPVPDLQTRTVWLAAPGWAHRINEAARGKAGLGGILCFDEISTAPPAVQAALLRPIHEGVVGDTPLEPNIARVAAANPAEVAAGGWDLTPPLANRFLHIDFSVDNRAWCDGMVAGMWETPFIPRLPEGWRKDTPRHRALVAAFIKARPSLLMAMPTEGNAKAFPTPRTWEMAATLLTACAALGLRETPLALEMVAGSVGAAAAGEFFTWIKAADLPDPEHLLLHPDKLKLPERPDIAYAILTSVTAACISNLTADRWVGAWKCLEQSIKQGIPDVGGAAARTLAQAYTDPRNAKLKSVLGIPKSAAAFGPLFRAAGIYR